MVLSSVKNMSFILVVILLLSTFTSHDLGFTDAATTANINNKSSANDVHQQHQQQPEDDVGPEEIAKQMAMRYTEQLTILTQLLDESVSDQTTFAKEKYDIGKSAFDAALKAFPDDTLPHAHSLFAKVCVKMAMYEESLELFDEAIRRSSLPLEQAAAQGGNMASQEIMEAQYLIRQLMMERNRSNSMIYQSKVNAWDQATAQGIPLDTSPLVPLEFVKSLLKVFPAPHPQALFEQATLNVLALDTPKQEDADDNIKDDTEESSTSGQINENGNFFHAWETWDMYRQAQDSAFGAYTIGKQYTLAGGKRCNEKDDLLGIVDGGTEWSRVAHKSTPFAYNEDQYHGDGGSTTEDNDMYMGIITIDSAVVSGKDAVVSGYGDNCLVFVPHPYVNLANNLPMVSAWEAEAEERQWDLIHSYQRINPKMTCTHTMARLAEINLAKTIC